MSAYSGAAALALASPIEEYRFFTDVSRRGGILYNGEEITAEELEEYKGSIKVYLDGYGTVYNITDTNADK
jgi:hypothetical protein